MKKTVRSVIASVLTAVTAVSASITSYADWETKGNSTFYQDEGGNYLTGWQTIDDKEYYFRENGSLVTKPTNIDGIRYKFGSDGVCKGKYTGFSRSSKGRRYWKNGENIKNDWIELKSGKIYYAGKDGFLRTGWVNVTRGEGFYSYFDDNGLWDGKTYYMGYQPRSLRYFFMDFDFSPEHEYEYIINFKGEYKPFDGIDTVLDILEADIDAPLLYDEITDDEQEVNEDIHIDPKKQINIRRSDKKSSNLIFSKDENGDSYVYCSYLGFGCKLSDSGAYDKIMALVS